MNKRLDAISHVRPSAKRARRKKKKNRRTVRCLALITILALIIGAALSTAANANKFSETDTVYITNGDTLWSIAKDCNTENRDIRSVMDDIMKLNGMHSAKLVIGERLIIPVY